MRITSASKHAGQAVLEGALVSLLVVGLMAGTAFAGRGGGGKGGGGATSGGGTISLSSPITNDKNGNGLPNWGDIVQFDIATTATSTPYVNLKCYQGGVLVAEGWRGYFEGSLDYRTFGLYGGGWMSGAADCTAYLDAPTSRGGMKQLASTTFHVDA
jgi:hypothetical protein